MKGRFIVKITYLFLFGSLIVVTPLFKGLAHVKNDETLTQEVVLPPVKVVKNIGWELPTKERALAPTTVIQLAGVQVDKEAFDPKDRVVEYEEYYAVSPRELRIETQKARVGTFFEYSRKGRKFAVQTVFSPIIKGSLTASVYSVFFIDGDGDGQFEQRYMSTQFPEIPQWVKDLN